jgi:hypothetical protein
MACIEALARATRTGAATAELPMSRCRIIMNPRPSRLRTSKSRVATLNPWPSHHTILENIMTNDQKSRGASASDELNQAHAHAEPKGDSGGGGGGEDEGSAPVEGHDEHLKDDQKPITK